MNLRSRLMAAGACLTGLAMIVGACGSSDAGVEPGAPEGVSDEEYLAILCSGLREFSNALIGSAEAEEIRAVIESYAADMAGIVPPRDASEFHAEYVVFLEEAALEPLILSAAQPPLPPATVRQRFTIAERDVEECETPTFFAMAGAEAGTTPAP